VGCVLAICLWRPRVTIHSPVVTILPQVAEILLACHFLCPRPEWRR
jgi:hypothetical protein